MRTSDPLLHSRAKANTENYLLLHAWVQFTRFLVAKSSLCPSSFCTTASPAACGMLLGLPNNEKRKRMASSHGSSCQNIAMRIANRSLTSHPATPSKGVGIKEREKKIRRKDRRGGRRLRYRHGINSTPRKDEIREDQRLSVTIETKTSLINESNGRMRTHKNTVRRMRKDYDVASAHLDKKSQQWNSCKNKSKEKEKKTQQGKEQKEGKVGKIRKKNVRG